jgi:hypothetical protein
MDFFPNPLQVNFVTFLLFCRCASLQVIRGLLIALCESFERITQKPDHKRSMSLEHNVFVGSE